MRECWLDITEEKFEKFKPIIESYIKSLENKDIDYDGIDLSGMGINPQELKELLIKLGYEDLGTDTNGWQCDYWVGMEDKNRPGAARKLLISGTAMYFSIRLCSDAAGLYFYN